MPLNHWRMKGKALQPWIGLPNIIAREFLVPELLQDACTPENLAREAESLLADAPAASACTRPLFNSTNCCGATPPRRPPMPSRKSLARLNRWPWACSTAPA